MLVALTSFLRLTLATQPLFLRFIHELFLSVSSIDSRDKETFMVSHFVFFVGIRGNYASVLLLVVCEACEVFKGGC